MSARREIRTFFTAVMFLTRLPVPRSVDHSPEYLNRAPRYYPLVGLVVGSICAGVYWLAALAFPPSPAILLSILAGLRVTGAFHEDGWADVCDGFGGGWTKEKILSIMKDSRLGTFGVAGLVGMLAMKFLLLQSLQPQTTANFLLLIVAGHGLSRLAAISIMPFFDYVRAKDAGRRSWQAADWLPAMVAPAIPLIFLPAKFLPAIIPMALATWLMGRYFQKWIGGYTGDCLGAIQQVTEVVFYAGAYLLWQYF